MLARTLEDVKMPGEAKANEITPAFLDAFADAWNRHDVDAIMSAMTDDCVFEASAGVGVRGTVYDGQRQVQKGSRRCSSNSRTRDGVDPSTSLRETEVCPNGCFQALGTMAFVLRSKAAMCSRSGTERSPSRTLTESSEAATEREKR